jgi:hypothetical protein
VAYNFQIGKKIKQNCLRNMKVNSKKGVLLIESILQRAKQILHAQFYFVVSGLKILGHGNTENNLESHCTGYISCKGETDSVANFRSKFE